MAEVVIYTNRGCHYCVMAKHYLDSKKVQYTEKKLGKSRSVDQEFAVMTNNAKKIPQIFIAGEWIGGYEELLKYDKAGELDWRLGLEDKPKVRFVQKITRLFKGEKY